VASHILKQIAAVTIITLGNYYILSDAEAATGISTTALGGGVVTVGSVGSNQMDSTADFTVAAGDTLVILGTDPVSGGGSTFGHKVILLPGSTIQLDNDLIVNGDGTDALDVDGTVTVYTNTGNLTLNDRINNVGDPVSIVKTGAGNLTLENTGSNIFPTSPAAAPNIGVDAPEIDVQGGTITNSLGFIAGGNFHVRVGDNAILTSHISFQDASPHAIEIGNSTNIGGSVSLNYGSNHTITIGDDNTIAREVRVFGGSNNVITVGDRNTIGNASATYSLVASANGSNNTITIGEGNTLSGQTIANGNNNLIHILPGATVNDFGAKFAYNTSAALEARGTGVANVTKGLHIEGMVNIAGGDLKIRNDSFGRLYATGTLTFADPSIRLFLNSSVFQIDKDYAFDNVLELAGAGSELKVSPGTTTTINVNVIGAAQDLTISDTGTLALNASVPQHVDLTNGGDFILGAAGSVPGDVTGNDALAQNFTLAGTITGTIHTGNANNIVNVNNGAAIGTLTSGTGINTLNINAGGTVTTLTAGTGDDTVTVDGTVTGTLNLGDGTNTVDVNNGGSVGTLASGTGNNTFNINTGGTVTTLTAGTGDDTVTVDGTVTGTLNLGDGTNTVDVNNGGSVGTLASGTGNNTFNINSGSSVTAVAAGSGDDTFNVIGTVTGTLDTGNGDNIVNLNSGGTLGALTTGNGNDTIDIDGNITGATNLGDGINNVDVSASSTIGDITFGAGNDTITVWGKAGNIMLGAGVNVLSIGPGSVVGNITGDPAGTDTITVAGDTGVIDGVTGAITASQNSKITIKGITASLTMNDGACAAVTGGGQIAGNVTLNDNSKLIAQADSDFQGNVTANDSANITLGSSPSGTVTITNGTLTVPAGTAIGADINQAGIGNINIGAGASMTGALAFSQDTILENVKVKKASMAAGKKLTLRTSTVLEMAELTPAADVNTQIILDGTKVDMNTTTWANNISKMVIINDGTLFSSGSDNLSNVSIDNFSQNSLDLVTLNTTMSPSTAALTIASYNAYDPGNEGTLVVGIDTLAGSRSQWLSVVGNANITDSKLIVVANRDSTFNSYSDSYDVIEYGGVRTGSFATLELQNSEREVASGLTAAADYSNAGRVSISLAKLSNYADNLGANANQSAQIAALDASSNAFLNQLDWDVRMASSDNARLILDQVSAEGYQMLYQNDRNQAQNFNQAMFERSRQRLFERERPYHSTWVTPSWNYARADNHGSYYGHEIKASGIDFGFDRKHKRYRMLSGLALGFRDSSSQSKLNLKDSGKHYHLGWYLHALSGPDHFMNLQASLSYNQHDSKRDIAAGDYTGRLTSDNNSYVLAADAKLGTHVFDNWGHSYTPYLALSTIYQDGDNIVESSNDTTTQNLALSVDKHNRWHGYIGLGSDMRLTRKNALIYNFHVKPVLSLEYLTEFSNNANKALDTAFSIDPETQFAIRGIHVGRHTGSLGFSLEGLGLSKRTKGHFFNAGYNAKVRSQGNVQHAFNINYQWKW
jgi:hypothetical protein